MITEIKNNSETSGPTSRKKGKIAIPYINNLDNLVSKFIISQC